MNSISFSSPFCARIAWAADRACRGAREVRLTVELSSLLESEALVREMSLRVVRY